MKKLITLLLMMGTLTLTAVAQTPAAKPDTATVMFISEATLSNMKEINTGQLAITHSKSTDIKALGTKMVTEHSKANTELMQIADSKGWQLTPPATRDITPDTMLRTSYGASFDKMYLIMMLKDHKETIAFFELGAVNIPNPEVRAFAVKTLPVLKQHLTDIRSAAAKLGVSE